MGVINKKIKEEMTRKISNSIWEIIKDYADWNCSFEWEVNFLTKDNKTMKLFE